ncbi:MAG: glycosyltransferase family A protein [Nitrospiraceae bacterium]
MGQSSQLVSVVIPVYNAASFIREALASVSSQTFRNYQLICVDDGSTDSSLEILSQASSEFRFPVRILQQDRGGPSMARNLGARHAAGRYLAFLDADDIWYPRKLEQQVLALESDPSAVLAHCNFDEIDEVGRLLCQASAAAMCKPSKKDLWAQLLGPQAWILPSTMMVCRAAYEHIRGFDPTLLFDEDADFCLRLRSLGEFVFLEEVGMAKRIHARSMTRNGEPADRQFAAGEQFLLKLMTRYANDREKLMLVHCLLASKYSDWGWHKIRTGGNRLKGLRLLSRSLLYDPIRFRTYSRLVRSLLPTRVLKGVAKRD